MATLTPDVEQRCRDDVTYAVTPAALARALGWKPARIRRAIYRGELEAELVAGERWVIDLDAAAAFVAVRRAPTMTTGHAGECVHCGRTIREDEIRLDTEWSGLVKGGRVALVCPECGPPRAKGGDR